MAICETCDYANRPPYKSPCSECDKTIGSPFCCYEHEEKPTNADRIRAMSDDELAEFIKHIKVRAALCKAVKNNDAFDELCSADWLQQSAE